MDIHSLLLAPGEYDIKIGMYIPETGERLTIIEGKDAIEINDLTVP
jgi:hypothetical protein